jgi:hypothetical protein
MRLRRLLIMRVTRLPGPVLLLVALAVGCSGCGGNGDGDMMTADEGPGNGGGTEPAGDISGTWSSTIDIDGACLVAAIPPLSDPIEITENGNDVTIQLQSASCGTVVTAQRSGDSVTGSGSRSITYQGCTVTIDLSFDVGFTAATFSGNLDLTFRDAVGNCNALLNTVEDCDDTGSFSGSRCGSCYTGCAP